MVVLWLFRYYAFALGYGYIPVCSDVFVNFLPAVGPKYLKLIHPAGPAKSDMHAGIVV
jgi:hypothetical protein